VRISGSGFESLQQVDDFNHAILPDGCGMVRRVGGRVGMTRLMGPTRLTRPGQAGLSWRFFDRGFDPRSPVED